MKLDKQQQNLIAIAVAAVVLIGVVVYMWILPWNKQIYVKVDQLAKIYAEIESLDAKAMQLETLKRQNEILAEELKRSEKKLPSREELANLIRYINETTQISAISVQTLRPMDKEKKDYYEIIPFQFDVVCNYHNLAQFINTINQAERIISTKDLVVNAASSNEPESVDTIRGGFTVMTYMVNR